MKKFIYLFIFSLLFLNTSVNAELDWDNINELNRTNSETFFENEYYSVNYENLNHFSVENYDTFYDKENSSSTIGIDVQKVYLGDYYNYYTLYNQNTLNDLGNTVLSVFKKDITPNTKLNTQSILTFSTYPCFYYNFEMEPVENSIYNCWYYIIFSDNYRYEIAIYSFDKTFVNDFNVSNFINSFKINDTTNICIPITQTENISPTNENSESYQAIIFVVISILVAIFVAIILIHKERNSSNDSEYTSSDETNEEYVRTKLGLKWFNFYLFRLILGIIFNVTSLTNCTDWISTLLTLGLILLCGIVFYLFNEKKKTGFYFNYILISLETFMMFSNNYAQQNGAVISIIIPILIWYIPNTIYFTKRINMFEKSK